MPAKSDPRESAAEERYSYRRPLGFRDLIPAIGAGIVAGAAVFYLTAVLRQRTPLVRELDEPRRKALPRPRG